MRLERESFPNLIIENYLRRVNEEYRTKLIFPPADDIFNAFHFTPLNEVKVVILGQDPYHNRRSGTWLCFSV